MKRILTLSLSLAIGGLAATAPSQTPILGAKEKIRKRVEAMRKAMREGKVREFNVYVKVWLKNGNRLRGVVKNGKFVEMHDGIDFVASAERHDKRSGMRVWYSVGTNSYVFLRYEEIRRYEIGSKLSDAQVKAIELKLEKALADTRENYRRLQEAKKKLREAELAKRLADAGGTGEVAGAPKLTKEQETLLKEFPPDDGWGEQRIALLKKRRITLGVFPKPKELRFEKRYDAWAAAFAVQQKIDELAEETGSGSAGSKVTKSGEKSTGGGSGSDETTGKDSKSKTGAVTSKPPK